MWSHIASASVALAKRASEDPEMPNYTLPTWSICLLLVISILFLHLLLFTGYTLKTLLPVLAIVENPSPPSYEAVASDDNDATPAAALGPDADADDLENAAAAAPITSSVKRSFRLLYAAGGWRNCFRGFFLTIVINIATAIIASIFSSIPFVPALVGALLAALALVQLNVAWVHSVIRSAPTSRAFWRNLPPFRRTLEATALPVSLVWLASTVALYIPVIVGSLLGLPTWDRQAPNTLPAIDAHMIWKLLVIGIIRLVLVFVLIVPATVVLIRVQASLLPPEEDTVVPFDRSFGGGVEPLVVSGRGYASVRDAFRTFSRSSWRRLFVLYVKVYALSIAANLLYAAVVVPIIVFTAKEVPATPSN